MFHFLLLYQGCVLLREARIGSFFALILWKLKTRIALYSVEGVWGSLCLGTMCGEVVFLYLYRVNANLE